MKHTKKRAILSAVAMLVVSAIMLITVATLADGYFYWQEQRLMKRDKMINNDSRILYRDRIAQKGHMQIIKILSSPQASQADTKAKKR
jgi:hypothetical protein